MSVCASCLNVPTSSISTVFLPNTQCTLCYIDRVVCLKSIDTLSDGNRVHSDHCCKNVVHRVQALHFDHSPVNECTLFLL